MFLLSALRANTFVVNFSRPVRKSKSTQRQSGSLLTVFLASILSLPEAALALCPSSGAPLIVSETGTVTAKFMHSSPKTEFDNDLYLDEPANSLGILFNNKRDTSGTTKVLGFFPAGTELTFRLHVNNTDRNYYTGAADRNPDALPHANVSVSADGTTVGFEDLFGLPECPEGSFTDLQFSFTNTKAKFVEPDRYVNFSLRSAASSPLFAERTINIRDRFHTDGVEHLVGPPFQLAMPAGMASRKIRTNNIALTGHRLLSGGQERPATIDTTTVLGNLRVSLLQGARLMVPSSFSANGVVPMPSFAGQGIVDPLKCYTVSYKRNGFNRLTKLIPLRSKFSTMNTYRILRPLQLCTAAAIDSASFLPNRSDTHLMCFKVVPENGVRADRVRNIYLNSGIGSSLVNTVRNREVCLPSTLAAP